MTWLPANYDVSCLKNSCEQSNVLTLLTFLIQYFGNSYDNLLKTEYEKNSISKNEFDFIIVGAGSAGCVLANRLSEEKEWKILLLEAGDEEPLVAEVPGLSTILLNSNVDYAYSTLPEPVGSDPEDRRPYPMPRGKVMGGTSTINSMWYVRGNREDYNDWAKLGNPGWSWEEVLPYFKKSENANDPNILAPNSEFHGRGGYLTVDQFPAKNKYDKAFIDAWKEIGLNETDYNNGNLFGVGRGQFTNLHGSRMSTNGAFIRPIRGKRHNLIIKPNARVTNIIIDPRTKQAYGVEYEVNDGEVVIFEQAYAKKEVILSAGVVDSPRLLMLSGIGPAQDLQSLNIEVIKDAPVGFNLQNHIMAAPIVLLTNINGTLRNLESMKNDLVYWMNTHGGPLSTIESSIAVTGFYQTSYETRPGVADIQLFAATSASISIFGTEPDAIYVFATLLSPRSKGYIKLNNTDPSKGHPEIRMNYLTDSVDTKILIEGLRFARKVADTAALKTVGLTYSKVPSPGCQNFNFDSNSYLECFIKKYMRPLNHGIGTCKMGPISDKTSVVDSELKVHGIDRLRVVDASIMPFVVKGNTNAPTIMIGEKGSDIIKKRWL